MTEETFMTQNEEKWKALDAYNRRLVHGGLKKMSDTEVRDFAALFRLAGYHLAYAKTHYPHGPSMPYLNRIVGVAHNYFYVRETGSLSDIKRYFLQDFPRAVSEVKWFFWAAALLFMVGALFAGPYVAMDTARFSQIFPGEFTAGSGGSSMDYSLMSAAIMTNNIRVAVSAFALGIFAGAGTVVVLIYNGIVVGGLAGYLAQTGYDGVVFLSLILPHGILELTAIFLSGACGLMIGRAVLIPGRYTRKDALIMQAKAAAMLIPGIIVMLVLAGLIEGFFTPLPLPPVVKLVFAGLTLAGLLGYLYRALAKR